MSTVCFDIKRADRNYVCIQHCDTNKFEYDYHLPLSFYPRQRKGKNCWWLEDKKYKYIWVLIEKDARTGIEYPVWACNDKIWFNHCKKEYFKNCETRIVKLPFMSKEVVKTTSCGFITRWTETNLKDTFKLYCPIKLNRQHHVYSGGYKELRPKRGKFIKVDGKKLRFGSERRYKWLPPKKIIL